MSQERREGLTTSANVLERSRKTNRKQRAESAKTGQILTGRGAECDMEGVAAGPDEVVVMRCGTRTGRG